MIETGMGGGKRNGSASTPYEVPSNFSAVVAPVGAEIKLLTFVDFCFSRCFSICRTFVMYPWSRLS